MTVKHLFELRAHVKKSQGSTCQSMEYHIVLWFYQVLYVSNYPWLRCRRSSVVNRLFWWSDEHDNTIFLCSFHSLQWKVSVMIIKNQQNRGSVSSSLCDIWSAPGTWRKLLHSCTVSRFCCMTYGSFCCSPEPGWGCISSSIFPVAFTVQATVTSSPLLADVSEPTFFCFNLLGVCTVVMPVWSTF